ncbi:MAG: hypothetical protein P8178_16810 [Candidatus Thiodiazotropha sp.]
MTETLPKDFIETAEGLIFAVVAAGAEEERILAFLRYRRTPTGFEKFSTREANALIDLQHPIYRYFSKPRDVTLHGVPIDAIARHHRPRHRLQAITHEPGADGLVQKLARLVALFTARGLDSREIGVTGSLLIGAHNRHSDIDLVFYRREAFFQAREIVRRLVAEGRLQPLDDALWRDAYERRGCSLDFETFLWHERRKHNKAAIEQTKFDLSLLPEQEASEPMRFRKLGPCRVQCRISDDSRGFDYPARFGLDHPEIAEVVSYTATYAGQARDGEPVEIRGQLEQAEDGRRRIIIGSDREAAGEYLVVTEPQKSPIPADGTTG